MAGFPLKGSRKARFGVELAFVRPLVVSLMLRCCGSGLRIAAAVAVVASLAAGIPRSGARAAASLDTVHEIYAALRACWLPPGDTAQGGVQVTVRMSFKRDGAVLGEPLISYENPGFSDVQRAAIRAAVAATLQRCGPLPLSAELGSIIAGHPISVRFGEGWRRKGRGSDAP
jgi:hypothetical protein